MKTILCGRVGVNFATNGRNPQRMGVPSNRIDGKCGGQRGMRRVKSGEMSLEVNRGNERGVRTWRAVRPVPVGHHVWKPARLKIVSWFCRVGSSSDGWYFEQHSALNNAPRTRGFQGPRWQREERRWKRCSWVWGRGPEARLENLRGWWSRRSVSRLAGGSIHRRLG